MTTLAAEGLSPKAIAQRVGLTRQTVAIWLRAGSFPERHPLASRRRRMLITPYEPYLRERWQAGAQHSRQLWRELQAKGFTGGSETVRRLTVRWRTEHGRIWATAEAPGGQTSDMPRYSPCSDTSTVAAPGTLAVAQA